MKYIIISPSNGSGKNPVFWLANNAGYTSIPFLAGIYDEKEVKARIDYYNNGFSAVAIPLTDIAMDRLGFECSYQEAYVDDFLQRSRSEQ